MRIVTHSALQRQARADLDPWFPTLDTSDLDPGESADRRLTDLWT